MFRKGLVGKRVAVLAADGFEQVELTVPLRALRRGGAEVRVISLKPGGIRGVHRLARAGKIPVDEVVAIADPEEYDALFIPGGLLNPDLLRQSAHVRRFVRGIDEAHKPIAVLGHGPWVLASAGLVKGRRLTSWPGVADDLRNAGAQWEDAEVVRDGNWITSRGPQDLLAFKSAMVSLFEEHPSRSAAVIRKARWPRALLAAGALAVGAVAIRQARQAAAHA